MTPEDTLAKLDAALQEPSLKTGFPDKDACLRWASEVAPLLKFEPAYFETFRQHLELLHLDLSADALGASLETMITQARMAAADLRVGAGGTVMDSAKAGHPHGRYVHPRRMTELAELSSPAFDLTKLRKLLEELDLSFRQGNCFAAGMLLRAILDHVPPIFGQKSFTEVANNYAGSKSFRQSMQTLDNSSRYIADRYLHTQARQDETLPTPVQVDFSPDVDVLLEEIVHILK